MPPTVNKIFEDYFEYNIISDSSSFKVDKMLTSLSTKFNIEASQWNKEVNSIWLIRNYLAIKMIMSSTVLLTSADYSDLKNIKISLPFLRYYALLNCSRAVIYTSPFSEWKNGEIIKLSHQKIINVTSDIVKNYNNNIGEEFHHFITCLRDLRELFSYRFPAQGLGNAMNENNLNFSNLIYYCRLLCEIAQYSSEVLEKVLDRKLKANFELDEHIIINGCNYEIDGISYTDDDDYGRLGYYARKQRRPYSLFLMMSEGMIDDFFGAWSHEERSGEDLYDGDNDKRVIFPFP